jgi:hypothetical protein
LEGSHLAQLLLNGAYPRERSPMSGPYVEGRGLCNEVTLGMECLLSQTSSRVTTPTVLGKSKENNVMRYLQESFHPEAKSTPAKAGAVESVAYSKNSLASVSRS